jgi:hypothetical protein
MPHDSGSNTQPVVELDVLSTNSAILCLHEEFANLLYQELQSLSLNPIVILPRDNMSSTLPYVLLSQLESQTPLPFDYLFIAFPSFVFTPDQLSFVLRLAYSSGLKIIIIDSQINTKSFGLNKILQKYPELDYRVCLVKDFYAIKADQKIHSPLESFIAGAKQNSLKLKYPQKNFYPTSFDQIIQATLKATFKFSSYHKTYYLSSLESTTHLQLANTLKNHISGLQVEEIFSDKPQKDQSLKAVVSTQAELDWYPDNTLGSYLRDIVKNIELVPDKDASLLIEESQADSPNKETVKPVILQNVYQPISKPISRLGEDELRKTTPLKKKEAPPEDKKNKVDQTINIKKREEEGSHVQLKQLRPISQESSIGQSQQKSRRFFGVSKRGLGITFLIVSIIFVVASPLFASIGLGVLAVNSLKSGLEDTGIGKYQSAGEHLEKSQKLFDTSRTLLTFFVPTKVVFSEKIDKYDRLLDSASKFVPIAQKSNRIRENVQKLYHYVGNQTEQPIDYETVRINIKDDSEELYNNLVNLDFSLQRQDFDSSFADFQKLVEFKNSIPKMRQDLKKNLELLNTLSLFLNTSDVKNYLVLAQNTTELRPTGGFIEAAGVITVKNGQILDYAYSDIYALDQKLQGFVAPPVAIKKYLGEPNWFLRDSNWDSDFSTSAKQAMWFYEREADRRVDGVIALDTEIVKALMEVVGPIELKDWGLVINHTNIYEKLLYQPKKDPEPGQEAKYLLVDLLSQITQNLLTKPGENINTKSLVDLLDEAHIQLYLKNPVLQKQITDSAFAGTVNDRPCFSKFTQYGCVSETFSLNEANVGINKVNYFIKRSIDQEVSISSTGNITHKIMVNYENSSPATAWPGGDYKVYARFNAPLGSQIVSLSQDGQPVGLEDTKASSTLGLAEFSFPFTVKSGKNSMLTIELRSPRILNPTSPQSAISINWEKQSGSSIDPIRLTFSYPEVLKVGEINQKANVSPGRAQFLDQFATDQTYALSFTTTVK